MRISIASAWIASLALSILTSQAFAKAPTCSTMQDALFNQPTIKVKMIFGYKDARPARFVGDRHERIAFVDRILADCEGDNHACGFERTRDNADLFTKKIWIGNRSKQVQLWVVNSSVGTDDEENRADPFQTWRSQYAQNAFLSGLGESDIVLYNGHSRFGGGPDFRSPILAEDGTVDPRSYKSKRRSLNKLLTALEESAKPKSPPLSGLKMLGLFSCTSSQHFNAQIRKVSDAGLVSSNVLMYYSDALEQSLTTLSDVLDQRCPKNLSFN